MSELAAALQPLFGHADFYVFDKPAGISFHSEQGAGFFAQLQAVFPQETLYPVHRLDKMTSGLLLVARTAEAARLFQQMFAEGQIAKTYLALTDHKPQKKQGTISGDMARSRNGSWKLLRTREHPAITRFTSHGVQPGLRLCILQPQTGRTHQLRVMMKANACPILGDARYGGTPAARGYLHAWRLDFVWRGESIGMVAPVTPLLTGLSPDAATRIVGILAEYVGNHG